MTVNELIAFCESHGISGDAPMRILAMGGMRHGKDIDSASVGFDWDHGTVILHTVEQLQVVGDKQPTISLQSATSLVTYTLSCGLPRVVMRKPDGTMKDKIQRLIACLADHILKASAK